MEPAPLTIEAWQSHEYAELHRVIEWKDGAIFKTRHVGYCRWAREREPDEIYVTISLKPGETLTLEPWFD